MSIFSAESGAELREVTKDFFRKSGPFFLSSLWSAAVVALLEMIFSQKEYQDEKIGVLFVLSILFHGLVIVYIRESRDWKYYASFLFHFVGISQFIWTESCDVLVESRLDQNSGNLFGGFVVIILFSLSVIYFGNAYRYGISPILFNKSELDNDKVSSEIEYFESTAMSLAASWALTQQVHFWIYGSLNQDFTGETDDDGNHKDQIHLNWILLAFVILTCFLCIYLNSKPFDGVELKFLKYLIFWKVRPDSLNFEVISFFRHFIGYLFACGLSVYANQILRVGTDAAIWGGFIYSLILTIIGILAMWLLAQNEVNDELLIQAIRLTIGWSWGAYVTSISSKKDNDITWSQVVVRVSVAFGLTLIVAYISVKMNPPADNTTEKDGQRSSNSNPSLNETLIPKQNKADL